VFSQQQQLWKFGDIGKVREQIYPPAARTNPIRKHRQRKVGRTPLGCQVDDSNGFAGRDQQVAGVQVPVNDLSRQRRKWLPACPEWR